MEASLHDLWLSLLSLWQRGDSGVANFKKEGLVTPEGWEGEKEILKFVGPGRELNLGEMPKCWPLDYPDIVIKRSRL